LLKKSPKSRVCPLKVLTVFMNAYPRPNWSTRKTDSTVPRVEEFDVFPQAVVGMARTDAKAIHENRREVEINANRFCKVICDCSNVLNSFDPTFGSKRDCDSPTLRRYPIRGNLDKKNDYGPRVFNRGSQFKLQLRLIIGSDRSRWKRDRAATDG